MKWFKFYGQDFLTDPKVKALSVEMRGCWVTLLCMANGEDKAGKIKYVNPLEVMRLTGIEEDGQTWYETLGFLEVFEDLEMITIDNVTTNLYNITLINYQKRQGEAKTDYQRVKEYRERKKKENNNDNAPSLSKRNTSLQNVIKNEANDNTDNENDNGREEKTRTDKNRKERELSQSVKYLTNIPEGDLQEFFKKYQCSVLQVKGKGEELSNYCEAKGKRYSNYKALLHNALKKDFGYRKVVPQLASQNEPEISEEQRLKNLDMIAEQKKKIFGGMN